MEWLVAGGGGSIDPGGSRGREGRKEQAGELGNSWHGEQAGWLAGWHRNSEAQDKKVLAQEQT